MPHASAPAPMFPVDLDGSPKIVLAGREWSVPPLAIKQASKVVPALMGLLPLITQMTLATETDDNGVTTIKDEAGLFRAMASITEEKYEIASRAVFWSLKRGYPQMSQAEFEEMPITMQELFGALPIVMRQTGFIKTKPAGDIGAGEVPAVDR